MARLTDPAIDAQNATGRSSSRDMILCEFTEGPSGAISGSADETINGQFYRGAGSLVSVTGIEDTFGGTARNFDITIAENPKLGLTLDTIKGLRDFGWYLQPIFVQKLWLDQSGVRNGDPEVVGRGLMQRISHTTPANGQPPFVTVSCTTQQRIYHNPGGNVSDHQTQQLIDPTDTAYKRIAVAGSVNSGAKL